MSTGAISFNEQNFECYTPKYIVDMLALLIMTQQLPKIRQKY
jgi:hypothetical protein